MNIILLGLFFSDDALSDAYKNSKCAVQIAPHKFQTNLLAGLMSCKGINTDVINVPPVGSYPNNYRRLVFRKRIWNSKNIEVGFLNLPILKRRIQINAIIREATKKILQYGESNTHLLIYHTFKPFLQCANILKKRFLALKISLIMTDPIPGRGDFDRRMSKRAVKEGNKIVELAKVCDSFVLLTKHMTEPLDVGDRPYTIVECISDSNQTKAAPSNGTRNICLYTGTVDSDFGILDVAEAFKYLKNAELWICGGGNASEQLKLISEKYHNIKYFGFVSQDCVADLRSKCDYLINPRRPTGTFTKFSFPSKTAEYMASGKPVIMYKLEGIPDEYDAHLNYLTACTPEEISEELMAIFETPYTNHLLKADTACTFIKNEKSPEAQAKKIVKMMNDA